MNYKFKNLLFILLLFTFIQFKAKATERKDSLDYKFGVGYNLFSGIPNVEAGFNFEFKLHKNIFLEASYYHTFLGFKIVASGASSAYEYNPTFGDKCQLGLRLYHKHKRSSKIYFWEYRLGYKSSTTPKYMNRDGSNGLNGTYREVLSLYSESYRGAFAVGEKQLFGHHFYMEESGAIGLQYVFITKHLYSNGDSHQTTLPPNTLKNYQHVYPYIEISVRIGFGF